NRRHDAIAKYRALGEEQARRGQEDQFGIENSIKAYVGELGGLKDPALMSKKRLAEEKLRRSIAADPAKQKKFGDAWDLIARERKEYPQYNRQVSFLESGAGFNSDLFGIARDLVRLAAEKAKPNNERLPEYTDARLESLELELFSPAPIYDDFEKIKLANSLAFMQTELGADDPAVKMALAGKTPDARAAELIDGTRVKDVAFRKELAAGGSKAIEQSTDPMIRLAVALDPDARKLRTRLESEVQSVERANYAKIAQALFAIEGTKLYPDATFTLRLSYGAVKGYQENGKLIKPFTNIGGLYTRAASHGNKFPFEVPQSWM